jgi:hypothetical protein
MKSGGILALNSIRDIFDSLCGRFTQHYTWEQVRAFLSVCSARHNLRPRYNITLTDTVDVIWVVSVSTQALRATSQQDAIATALKLRTCRGDAVTALPRAHQSSTACRISTSRLPT